MSNRLKGLRGKVGLTQSEVAAKVGVSQPTYQRWEAGSASVPRNKLGRLALALGTDLDTLHGRQAPVEAVIYSQKKDDEAGYWGEAAFHFRGKGEPLLLTISDNAYSRLYRDLQGDEAFLTVRSMANQTVVIRRNAIKDVYLSSEAHDDFGVEGMEYKGFAHIMIPDQREWAVIAAISDGVAADDYSDEDIERANQRIGTGDKAQLCLDHATKTVWQFSDGDRRSESPFYGNEFYPNATRLVDYDPDDGDTSLLRLEIVDGHRTIFINPESIDYLSLPTHAYEAAVDEAAADEIDELEG